MTVYQRDGTQTHPLPDQTPGETALALPSHIASAAS